MPFPSFPLSSDHLSASDLPRIRVPQGLVTTVSPAIEWESGLTPSREKPIQVEIEVTLDPSQQSTATWFSGTLTVPSTRIKPGLISLPKGRPAWIWVREREIEGGEWSAWNSLETPVLARPIEKGPEQIRLYDLSPTRLMAPRRAWEEAHLVSVLQGLVNRDAPRLFVTFLEIDTWWLDELREPEHWLHSTRVVAADSVEDLVSAFSTYFNGVVVWDRHNPATSNLASTLGGVENLLPVTEDDSPDSLWQRLVVGGPRLPIRRDLRGMFTGDGPIPDSLLESTGSAKCDAYTWARLEYLDAGRCDPLYLAYYIDAWWIRDPTPGKDFSNHTLTNHDYFVSKRAFFWDLNVWEDESPIDDQEQIPGTDRRTLIEIFRSAQRRAGGKDMIRVGGFNPWAFKYTDCPGAGGCHDGVRTEWETVRIATEFDALIDADALHLSGMANASFYQHYPLPEYLVQGPAPSPRSLRRTGYLDEEGRVEPKTYLLHYVGDYDSAAWALSQIPPLWQSQSRGRTQLSWALNPNLAERAAPLFEYLYRTRSGLDAFQSGDSGAGYVNPTGLLPPRALSELPQAGGLWQRHCAGWFRRMNLTVTGFIINALSGRMTPEAERLFASFSPDGIVLRDPSEKRLRLEGHLPCIPMSDEGLPLDTKEASIRIFKLAGKPGDTEPTFVTCRSVLHPPEFYEQVEDRLQESRSDGSVAIVDPRTFFYLVRTHLGGENTRRATWLFDTLARRLDADAIVSFQIGIRNDGWDEWTATGEQAVAVAVECVRDEPRRKPGHVALPRDVPPGDAVVLNIELEVPEERGEWFFRAELVRGKDDWFADAGCPTLEIRIQVS